MSTFTFGQQKIGLEYAPISSVSGGDPALTQTLSGIYTYHIANLVGTGLRTSDIRALFILVNCEDHNYDRPTISATYPDGTTKIIYQAVNYTNTGGANLVVLVPINSGQTSVILTISGKDLHGSSHTFTIQGAWQV